MNRDGYIQAIGSVKAGEAFKAKVKTAMERQARPLASRGMFVTVACAAASLLIVCGMIVLYQFAPEDVWGYFFPTQSEEPVPTETAGPVETLEPEPERTPEPEETPIPFPEQAEFTPIYTADLLHNGTAQTIELDTARWSAYLRVVDTDGYALWQDEAGGSHSHWNTLFLVRYEGKDYLMRYLPEMSTGIGIYTYHVFSLNERGEEITLESGLAEFMSSDYYNNPESPLVGTEYEFFPREEVKAFMERAIYWIARGELLLTTDETVQETTLGYDWKSSPSAYSTGFITGSAQQPIAGLQAYFHGSPELSLDEQIDLWLVQNLSPGHPDFVDPELA